MELKSQQSHALSMFTSLFIHSRMTLSMKLEHGDEQHKIPTQISFSLGGSRIIVKQQVSMRVLKNDIKEMHVQGPTKHRECTEPNFAVETKEENT